MVGGGIDESRLVGEDAGFEVAVALPFHADAGTREVGGANVGHSAVENHYLEMHPRAESPLETRPETGVAVEVLAEVVAGLLGMQQADVDATPQQPVENGEEGFHGFRPFSQAGSLRTNIEVLQVGGAYPEVVLHPLAAGEHLGVVVAVGNVL